MQVLRSKLLHITVAAMALLSPVASSAGAQLKTISVTWNGKKATFKRYCTGTVASFLRQNHVAWRREDRIHPGLAAPLQDGMSIVIEQPKEVTVIDGGRPLRVQTFAATVAQLLHQLGLHLSRFDRISVPTETGVADGMTIQIRRFRRLVYQRARTLAYRTTQEQTTRLYVGEQEVVRRGQPGLEQTRVITTTLDGQVIGRTVVRRVIRPPVDEVIAVGTRPRPTLTVADHPRPPVLAARSAAPGPALRSLTVVATAYIGGGRTATGVVAQPGVVAVDPNVIPFGTKLYIPGYGFGYAADSGGAIAGNRIDVCFSSQAEALAWGVRTLTIYVVADAS